MIDVLAPLAVAALALGVVAFVWSARRQRAGRRDVFRWLAEETGRRLLAPGDESAAELFAGFAGFGRAESPSLGRTPPEAVVVGRVDEGEVGHLLQGVRVVEGEARLWTVCVVAAGRDLCGGASLRLLPRAVRRPRQAGGDSAVPFPEDTAFEARFEVLSPDPDSARGCLAEEVRRLLVEHAGSASRPFEVEVRDRRLAVALAQRNDEAREVGDLRALERVARSVVGALLQSGGRSVR